MHNWTDNAIFYHIYPLGLLGCERYATKSIHHRITTLVDWIPHFKKMNMNALYLGPIFSSYEHGYDTSDYQVIDTRLGTNEDFKMVCQVLHQEGIRIILDGVFNHVGRDFWAFQDVLEHQEASLYKDWFHINFQQQSPYQDPFTYEAWEGHYNLVKLNLHNEDVIQYLLASISLWMEEFQIDGLRLDAADCIEPSFFQRLKTFCKQKKPNFWLMGEIIHGDYNRWANPEMLDSVTNYECYKGLYSSHNEKNYFEIAYSLDRQFGNGGIYKDLYLYNFVDNHDVNRIASVVKNHGHLKNLYTLLYAIPGMPSIYYGSEYGVKGIKHDGSDADIRPCIKFDDYNENEITTHIYKLGKIYSENKPLQEGTYHKILVTNEQFVFVRECDHESIYAVFNIADETKKISFSVHEGSYQNLMKDEIYHSKKDVLEIEVISNDCMLLKRISDIPSKNDDENKLDKQTTPEVSQTINIGKYRHFKGKEYAVLYVATHSETLEEYVVYRQLYGNGDVWVRPLSMFMEMIERDGKKIPRFTYIGK